jgi:hypothetical protein
MVALDRVTEATLSHEFAARSNAGENANVATNIRYVILKPLCT